VGRSNTPTQAHRGTGGGGLLQQLCKSNTRARGDGGVAMGDTPPSGHGYESVSSRNNVIARCHNRIMAVFKCSIYYYIYCRCPRRLSLGHVAGTLQLVGMHTLPSLPPCMGAWGHMCRQSATRGHAHTAFAPPPPCGCLGHAAARVHTSTAPSVCHWDTSSAKAALDT
jgi:hypothetical protein